MSRWRWYIFLLYRWSYPARKLRKDVSKAGYAGIRWESRYPFDNHCRRKEWCQLPDNRVDTCRYKEHMSVPFLFRQTGCRKFHLYELNVLSVVPFHFLGWWWFDSFGCLSTHNPKIDIGRQQSLRRIRCASPRSLDLSNIRRKHIFQGVRRWERLFHFAVQRLRSLFSAGGSWGKAVCTLLRFWRAGDILYWENIRPIRYPMFFRHRAVFRHGWIRRLLFRIILSPISDKHGRAM